MLDVVGVVVFVGGEGLEVMQALVVKSVLFGFSEVDGAGSGCDDGGTACKWAHGLVEGKC